MVEYAYTDAYNDGVDHETDFIKELAELWYRQKRDVRIGVVVYHDTVSEAIHTTDYINDFNGLSRKLDRLSRQLKPNNEADLGKALDYVHNVSFTNARPNAEKIVVSLVHRMNGATKDTIIPAAQRLKNECTTVVGFAIYSRTIDYEIMAKFVTQPSDDHYQSFSTSYAMEESAKYVNDQDSACA